MTVAEERLQLAEVRAGLRRSGVVLSIVFFLLTSAAIAGAERLMKPVVTGVICIVLAEILMRRSISRGVIAALWMGGLFSLTLALPSEGRPEGWLLLAAACAIAGARVRNALIGALAPVFVSAYFAEMGMRETALLTGVIVPAIALVLLAREWKRPSTELLLMTMLIVPPVGGAAWTLDRTPIQWSFAYVVLAIAEIAFAIRMRYLAAIYGAAISLAIAAIAFRSVLPLATEWQLVIAGTALLALSSATYRAWAAIWSQRTRSDRMKLS